MSKQLGISSYFQPKPKKRKDGSIIQTIIPTEPTSSLKERIIKYKYLKYPMTFKTMQGLASHLNQCFYYREEVRMAEEGCTLIIPSLEMEPYALQENRRTSTINNVSNELK